MHDAIRIREFMACDYDTLITLWESIGLGGKHRGDNPEIIQQTLEKGGKLLLMEIRETGELIGTSWLTVDGRRTYLHHFGIAVGFQGMGLSKPLLQATMDLAREIGLQIKLEVYRSNEKAVNLYKSNGFEYLGDYDVYIIRDILNSLQ
jgi:ribosomal protein S18 acetylase RimI-like enzyme